jgi:hypothetical protein
MYTHILRLQASFAHDIRKILKYEIIFFARVQVRSISAAWIHPSLEGWMHAAEMKFLRAVKIRNKEDGSRNKNTSKTLTGINVIISYRKHAGPEITGGNKLYR